MAIFSLFGAAACTPPMILEDTTSACRNRYDDDGDGRVDCGDPDCAGTSACEASPAACTDGADNDGDGLTDCQQASCRDGGSCDVSMVDCDVRPQAGCLAGQGCYAAFMAGVSGATFRCRTAGEGAVGDDCDASAIEALVPRDRHPCAAGLGCSIVGSPHGVCAAYCFADADCPAGAVCNGAPMAPDRPGLCTVACNPVTGLGCLGPGSACRSFHEIANRAFAQGGPRFGCFARELRAGAGAVGAPCDDPPTPASVLARVCGGGTVCAPSGAGAICRASCDVGSPACPSGTTCVRLFAGGRPAAFGDIVLGYCE